MIKDDEILAQKMVDRLNSFPKEKWIFFYHDFNRWAFPMEFYDLLPSWWLTKGEFGKRRYNILSPVCDLIRFHFTEKQLLAFHNCYMGNMTEKEFEYWYEISRFSSDEVLQKYYDRSRKIEELHWWKDEVFEKIEKIQND
jgi:hypothetical protein